MAMCSDGDSLSEPDDWGSLGEDDDIDSGRTMRNLGLGPVTRARCERLPGEARP